MISCRPERFGFKYHIAKIEQPVLFLKVSGKPLKLNQPKDPSVPPFMSVNMYAGGGGNGDVHLGGVVEQVVPAGESVVEFWDPPWGDHFDVGLKGVESELEPDLTPNKKTR